MQTVYQQCLSCQVHNSGKERKTDICPRGLRPPFPGHFEHLQQNFIYLPLSMSHKYLPLSMSHKYLPLSMSHLVLPQPVPPIRKLPQASSPYPSEGRQNKNHNHRKLTKLITRITALNNSMKLWAMPCKATWDRQVMVESFDKTWHTGEGNGKPLQYSFFFSTSVFLPWRSHEQYEKAKR